MAKETYMMESDIDVSIRVHNIINDINSMRLDGETVQYIVEKTSMEYQMLRQLIMNSDIDDVIKLVKEKKNIG